MSIRIHRRRHARRRPARPSAPTARPPSPAGWSTPPARSRSTRPPASWSTGGVAEQTEQVFTNLRAVLAAAGLGPVQRGQDHGLPGRHGRLRGHERGLRASASATIGPPGRTVAVAGLPRGARVEIDVVRGITGPDLTGADRAWWSRPVFKTATEAPPAAPVGSIPTRSRHRVFRRPIPLVAREPPPREPAPRCVRCGSSLLLAGRARRPVAIGRPDSTVAAVPVAATSSPDSGRAAAQPDDRPSSRPSLVRRAGARPGSTASSPAACSSAWEGWPLGMSIKTRHELA